MNSKSLKILSLNFQSLIFQYENKCFCFFLYNSLYQGQNRSYKTSFSIYYFSAFQICIHTRFIYSMTVDFPFLAYMIPLPPHKWKVRGYSDLLGTTTYLYFMTTAYAVSFQTLYVLYTRTELGDAPECFTCQHQLTFDR